MAFILRLVPDGAGLSGTEEGRFPCTFPCRSLPIIVGLCGTRAFPRTTSEKAAELKKKASQVSYPKQTLITSLASSQSASYLTHPQSRVFSHSLSIILSPRFALVAAHCIPGPPAVHVVRQSTMDNFIPRRPVPLKEGRAHPFEYSPSYRKQKSAQNRFIVVVVGLVLTCLLALFFVFAAPASPKLPVAPVRVNQPVTPITNAPPIPDINPPNDLDSVPIQPPVAIPPVHQGSHLEEAAPPAAAPAPAAPAGQPASAADIYQPKQASIVDKSGPKSHGPRPGFGEALERVFSLLPDEIHQRELLRQLDGTGKEKLRELGLRTRAYKNFFEAWEDLHMVIDDDATYVRDDIMSYMRHYHDTTSNPSRPFPQMLRSYESFRYFFTQLANLLFPWPAPYFGDHVTLHASMHRGGRGIAMTAGDEQASYLLASIPSFRALGCELPIEIFYLGDSDLSEDFRIELEALDGVSTRDLSQMVTDEGWRLAGWAGKPFTILFSSFREVIFVDADALFFHNPAVLFDDPDYQRTGALFFKDRLIMPESKKRWLQAVLPKPISKQVRQSRMWTGDSGHMQESGVVVVDKWRHFIALLLVSRMNGPDRDGKKEEGVVGIYDMVYGTSHYFFASFTLSHVT